MDQPSRNNVTGERRDTETVMRRSEEGRWKRTAMYLAGGLSYRMLRSEGGADGTGSHQRDLASGLPYNMNVGRLGPTIEQ
jgi:hypothetical protein